MSSRPFWYAAGPILIASVLLIAELATFLLVSGWPGGQPGAVENVVADRSDKRLAALEPADAWIRLPTVEAITEWRWTKVHPIAVLEVQQAVRAKAIQRLDERPIVRLNEEELWSYAGCALKAGDPHKPYLVRGVAWTNTNGAFEVRYRGTTLWVQYGWLGRAGESKKTPLVILLTQEPETLFVDGGGGL
jgi:hypothetical protein